ncbi:ROK family protein [Clostridium tertium]|uniref:Fructokinase n=1 Tax=Clostridium tertium TaxID=1559 RepID=A0A6N2YV63_9CLOT
MKYYIGIDIGGTNLRAAILNENYIIIDKLIIENEVESGPKYNLGKLVSIIKEKWLDKEIIGVGVGCPGPLDIKNGKILVAPNLKTWEYFNVKEFLSKELNLQVKVNNDANVAALSEAIMGSGKGCESVYYITLSTGIGGGFIYKGEIVSGFNSIAAEVGNMIINEDCYKHKNMNYGGFEGQCSGTNISRIASKVMGRKITTKEVFDSARSGNNDLVNVINNWIINISKAIANIVITVDPEVIVLGGSVILNNKEYIEFIKEEVEKRIFDGIKVNIKLASMGGDTGLIGAGILLASPKF